VLVAKHLCGVATDISLRSAATFQLPPSPLPQDTSAAAAGAAGASTLCPGSHTSDSDSDSNKPYSSSGSDVKSSSGLSAQLKGVAIATCCHHACVWQDYVGASFLNSQGGITATEFDVLKQWSG
jgi:hypothetical protein